MSFALLAGLLVVLAVVLYILQPILTGEEAPLHRSEEELTEAEARKRVALLALRDVEYDFVTGKLDSNDYEELRGELTSEALSAMDAEGERGRGARATELQLSDEDELEAEIARLRSAAREGVLCPACGRPNGEGSRFCGSCGAPPGSTTRSRG